MHSGRASRQEIGALEGRVSDPELCNRFRVVGAPVELPFEILGDRRAAHVREAVDLAVVRDRHDARHDGHVDARGAGLVDVVEVDLVVEEELGDQEARARLHLLARVAQVARAIRGVEVHLGEARGAHAEVEALADQPDQLHRVGEPARVRLPRGLAARRVAAEGEHVLDAGGLDLLEELHEALARLADARQVRHRLDAEVALDRLRDLDGAVAGGAAGAVGHRDVVGLVVLQDLERVPERLLPLVGLRREELERKDGPLPVKQVCDPHEANLNTTVSRLGLGSDPFRREVEGCRAG